MGDDGSKGYASLTSAVIAMLGLVAALHPSWTLIQTLHAHVPELQQALPYVLTALGSLGAAVSHPPAWLRARVCRAWATLRSLATWGTR